MADAPIVSLADLSVTYAGADRPSLAGIDVAISAGEAVGVMGLTGAGKTTLGLCLNGVIPQLLPATITGRAVVAGHDPTTTPVREMARRVGMIFDNPEYQLSQPTVAEEIAFGLENLGVAPDAMPDRIAGALALVGLAGFEERSPYALSGGQQQRLAIAAALVMEPSILVMDEPTSNLDPTGAAEVFAIVRALNRERGMTLIVAEHDVEALAANVDRFVVLDGGRVVADGPTSDVLGRLEDLRRWGLRPPQVTELAAALAPDADSLPVTVDAAVAWLAARR
jgi:energy-coupling factor transporter ATP-binding protein EcfA2